MEGAVNGGKTITEQGRDVREQAHALSESVRDLMGEVTHEIERQMRERPYMTLGVAAGIGFVLGGGLGPRLLRTGGRLAANMLVAKALGAIVPQAVDE